MLLLLLQLHIDEDGDWTVWIVGGGRTSGTLADDVLMVIYGDNGKTDELRLADGQLCKDRLASNQFEVNLLSINAQCTLSFCAILIVLMQHNDTP